MGLEQGWEDGEGWQGRIAASFGVTFRVDQQGSVFSVQCSLFINPRMRGMQLALPDS